jgi:predicted lipoprotein with Yx(FWY)xxD motif
MRRRGFVGFLLVAVLAGTASVVFMAPAGAAAKPGAPGRPLVAPGKAQVKVLWTAPANHGSSPITAYVVTPFLGSAAQHAHTFTSAATTQVITGLANGRAYSFRVAARNAVGTSVPSAPSAPAIPTAAPTLRVLTSSVLGNKQIIVNSAGLTLYLFAPDGASPSSKAGGLIATWPRVVWSGAATVGPGLTAAKAAVHLQPNRVPQVSYNKHLLYTWVGDRKPGDVTGEGIAGFYVVSPAGNQL